MILTHLVQFSFTGIPRLVAQNVPGTVNQWCHLCQCKHYRREWKLLVLGTGDGVQEQKRMAQGFELEMVLAETIIGGGVLMWNLGRGRGKKRTRGIELRRCLVRGGASSTAAREGSILFGGIFTRALTKTLSRNGPDTTTTGTDIPGRPDC